MKRLLILILFVTFLSAKNSLTLIGGVNMGHIQFNEDMTDVFDSEHKAGLNIGIEKTFHPNSFNSFKLGGAFIQRGYEYEFIVYDSGDGDVIELHSSGPITFNYISGYALYNLNWGIAKLDKYFPMFIGLELGLPTGGESKGKSYDNETEEYSNYS